jgi:cellulose biosynthesis protein BcsQ
MKILATYSIKGGVGKTAAAVNLAYLSARQGLRTLVWDLDPQGAATFYFRVDPNGVGRGAALVKGRRALSEVVKGTDFTNLDLIPADFAYRKMDLVFHDTKRPAKQLLRLLRPLSETYDLIVLDSAPSISLVSENIFRAADVLLVPVIPTPLSERTYEQLIGHLGDAELDHCLVLPFFSMVDRRKRLHLEHMDAFQRAHRAELLDAVIPYASVVELMGVRRAPLGAFAPTAPAEHAFESLWVEVRASLGLADGLAPAIRPSQARVEARADRRQRNLAEGTGQDRGQRVDRGGAQAEVQNLEVARQRE